MNIIVATPSKRYIVRPDITWDKRNEDIYLPEFVEEVSWTPVFFARISRPGRSVAAKFANRYFDSVGYGVLLYPENLIDGSPEGFAEASCIDHTSILPSPFFDRAVLSCKENEFVLEADGKSIFRTNAGEAQTIAEAIEGATRHIFVRTGDIIAIELQSRETLLRKGFKETVALHGRFTVRDTIDFKISI